MRLELFFFDRDSSINLRLHETNQVKSNVAQIFTRVPIHLPLCNISREGDIASESR